MKFSTKTEYGLRVISHLDKTGKVPVSLALIAKGEDLSLAYLERLVSKLKKEGLVVSKLGAKGGYFLGRPANEINVLEIVEALEGKQLKSPCSGSIQCKHLGRCKINLVWNKLYSEVNKTLKNIKLSSIM